MWRSFSIQIDHESRPELTWIRLFLCKQITAVALIVKAYLGRNVRAPAGNQYGYSFRL